MDVTVGLLVATWADACDLVSMTAHTLVDCLVLTMVVGWVAMKDAV